MHGYYRKGPAMRSSRRLFRHRLFNELFNLHHARRRAAGGLLVGLLVAAVTMLALYAGLFSGIRNQLADSLYAPRPTTGITAVVAIDDISLGRFGRSTVDWDRQVHADLIARLQAAGARVIAFDILFADPSEHDDALAEAMRGARNVVLPIVGQRQGLDSTTQRGDLIRYDRYEYPARPFRDAARLLGHANVVPDGDGMVRQIPLVVMDGDQPVPSLALAAYMQYLRQPSMQLVEVDPGQVRFANRTLYTDDIGQMMIYYFGPPSKVGVGGSTYPVYSYADVIDGNFPADAFKDKIVLIGALDASGLPDSYATPSTPTGEKMFGVEIHANIIETIHQSLPTVPEIHNNVNWRLSLGPLDIPLYQGTTRLPLRPLPLAEQGLALLAIGALAGLLLPFLRWYVGAVVAILAYAIYFLYVTFSFRVFGRVLDLLYPAVTLLLVYLGTTIAGYIFEERRRGQINDLFSRYVSPEIAQKIVEAFDEGKLELGGEEREITVLFADVRGFTTLSEGMSPPEVVQMLNIFLERMTSVVMKHGGAINKYIGDNLMAFWNAPYEQDEHPWLATQAGLEMLEVIRTLNDEGAFRSPVQFGIGINTGPVVVGNVGSQRRLEYTPIGDTVNVASRLCGQAPGGACYVGGGTYELIREHVEPVAVHHLRLKGKAEEVTVYELRPVSRPAPGPADAPAPAASPQAT